MEENPVQPKSGDKPVLTPEQIKAAKDKKKRKNKRILWIIFIVIIILVPATVYFGKQYQISLIRQRHHLKIAAIQKKAVTLDSLNSISNLQTVARVFAWSVRSEMLRNNLDQVNQYMTELVKIMDYRRVLLLSPDGKVLLSTDKKYENEGIPKALLDQSLNGDMINVSPQKNGDLMVAAPVMGIDKKIGTVIITYTPSVLDFTDKPVNK